MEFIEHMFSQTPNSLKPHQRMIIGSFISEIKNEIYEKRFSNRERKVIVEINSNFNIPDMENKDAKRLILYAILRALNQGKSRAYVFYKGDKIYLETSFITNEEEQDEYIRRHTKIL